MYKYMYIRLCVFFLCNIQHVPSNASFQHMLIAQEKHNIWLQSGYHFTDKNPTRFTMDVVGFLLFLVVSLRVSLAHGTDVGVEGQQACRETLLKKKNSTGSIQDSNPGPHGQFHHGCKLSNPLETPWSVIVYNFQKVLLSAKTI